MKKYLLTGALITITATTLYATTAGSTVVDAMKAASHAFTLATNLNPGQTGLTSEPVKGKKTGDILTAGEYNRILELVSEGGSTSSSNSSTSYLQLTTPSAVTFTEGGKVPFTTVVSQKGDKIVQNGGEITLKGGSSYMISADIRITSINSAIGYTIINKSDGTGVGVYGANYTGSYTGSWSATSAIGFVSPTVDTTYFVRTSSLSGAPISNHTGGNFTVWELGGGGGSSSGAGLALYKCTNAQSLDPTNAPCYGASLNGGAGTNQYRVVSCSNTDASGTYTAGGLLNFGDFITNKWSFHINNSNLACTDGTILVMDIQGGGSGSASASCPSGFVAVGSFCIEPTMGPVNKTWYEAAGACADKGAQLCSWSEWAVACKKGILTDVQFGTTNGKYEWIDDYTGDAYQGIADPRVYSDCEYLSRAAPKTPNATTAYRCCSPKQ